MTVDTQDRERLLAFVRAASPPHRNHMNEMLTRLLASRCVFAGDAVIDGGANAGFHTAHLSALVGTAGVVHAFEPNPDHWPGLLAYPNVRLWPMAVGDRCSVETFFSAVGHDQIASLHDPRRWRTIEAEMRHLTVVQVPIDHLHELAERRIRFVKLDVEQNEAQALRGMRALIERDNPVIVLEGCDAEIEAFFQPLDYRRIDLMHGLFGGADTALPNVLFAPPTLDEASSVPEAGDVVALIEKLLREAAGTAG